MMIIYGCDCAKPIPSSIILPGCGLVSHALERGVRMLSPAHSIRDYCDRVWQDEPVGSEPEITS
jgi:hypothetical protein